MRHTIAAALVIGALGAGPAAAEIKTSFAPTTVQITTGHAAHSSIPRAMGYWKEEGLDVEVFGANGSTAGIQLLAAGNVDFCSVGGEALLAARAKGVKAKAIYMYARRSIYQTVVLASSPYKSLADLKGQTIGLTALTDGNYPYLKAALHSAGLDPEKDVKWLTVPTGAPQALALQKGDIQALSSWDTAVASIANRGVPMRDLKPSYYDELFGNVVIAREETIEKQPELVAKILRGIAKSTVFGFANPEAAIKIHWKYYPQTKPQGTDEKEMMRESMLVFTSRFKGFELFDTDKYGASLPAQWARATEIAKEQALVPASFDSSNAWTNQFVDEVNKFDRDAIVAQAKAWKE